MKSNLARLVRPLATCAGLMAVAVAAPPTPAAPETCRPGVGMAEPANPLASIHAHLCGFHFYSGDMKRAVRVDHYCSHLNADVFQCIVYDSDKPNARLIGVEYIISEALFKALPADEKKLWHSHRYEVMSGLLTASGLSGPAEKELMKEFANTYGKTWTLWQVDRGDPLPLGLPKLMMGFTADGQADPNMVAERDRDLKVDAAAVKAQRAGFSPRPVAEEADAWERDAPFQIDDDLLRASPSTPKP